MVSQKGSWPVTLSVLKHPVEAELLQEDSREGRRCTEEASIFAAFCKVRCHLLAQSI